jgi:hypothetical protein
MIGRSDVPTVPERFTSRFQALARAQRLECDLLSYVTMKNRILLGVFCMGVTALSATFGEQSAHACSPEAQRDGYVTALQSVSVLEDDTKSPFACVPKAVNSCGPLQRFEGITRALIVRRTLSDVAPASGLDTYIPRGQVLYTLRDATGKMLEQQRSSGSSVRFGRTGASVCVATQPAPSDAGAAVSDAGDVDAGALGSEFCAPVTVESLVVTEADRDAHAASLLTDCGATGTSGDGGKTTDAGPLGASAAPGTSGGGCVVGSHGSSPLTLLLPLAALILTRLRRRAVRSHS